MWIQVYVWLNGSEPHSFVLSRYLLARNLTMAKIPYIKVAIHPCLGSNKRWRQAVRISLHLKKKLVDSDKLDITQVGLGVEVDPRLERGLE